MNKLNLFLIALLTGTLTFALYTYKTSSHRIRSR